jgi:uncharacterized protein YecE (DUF72 family)
MGEVYPEDIGKPDMLEYYTDLFDTVEINNSFYGMPSDSTLAGWRDSVPNGFVFSIKASRYITHMKKLSDPEGPVGRFLERADVLGFRLGPVLFQLPPRWRCNPGRLSDFLDVLPPGYRYAMEFRDGSWFCDEVYSLLADRDVAFCIYHLAGRQSPKEVTSDFVYIRLHGPGDAYQGSYSDRDLRGWAGAISAWDGRDRDVYCYFDNDQRGYAARDAMRLKDMLEG